MKELIFGTHCLLALLIISSGCTKDPSKPGVAGLVTEFGTDKPINNASVYGIDCEGEPLGSISCFRTDSTHTNADGYYSMPKEPAWVVAHASGYWAADHLAPVLHKKELATNVSLYPFAWLKVTIRNESGAYAISSSEINTIFPLQQSIGSDTTFLHLIRGNQEYTYVYSIWTQPNQAETYSLKPFCPGHDTTTLLISY